MADANDRLLVFVGQIGLPPHASGGFDHGDVHLSSGRVFVAHTANGTVDVIDGERMTLVQSVSGCPEGSGVLVAGDLVFAAARGSGELLVIDALSCEAVRRVRVGPRPNGVAWDPALGNVLVADIETFDARLVEASTGALVGLSKLPGRPRWCIYDAPRRRFLVNIREPACVVALAAESLREVARIDRLAAGPHGLDLDRARDRAFVACDAGEVVVVDLATDREIARVPIAGEPDAIWYSLAADSLYVAIGSPGLVSVVDCTSLEVVQELKTEEAAHTTAYDSQRQRLYVFAPRSCAALVYEEKR